MAENTGSKTSVRFLRRVALLLLSILLLNIWVSAEENLESNPAQSYYFWQNCNGKKPVVDRSVFEVATVLDGHTLGISSFSNIRDIYVADSGEIYVLDSGNGRIVILNADYTLNRILDHFTLDGQEQTLNIPQGIFVEEDGSIWIADTENKRLLVCEDDGAVRSVITAPTGELIPDDFEFFPIKVLRDQKGFLYILSRGSYYGALTYDEEGAFCGFYGSNPVTADVIEQLERLWNRIFTNNEGAIYTTQKLPYQFADLCLDEADMLYTVSSNGDSNVGQIRKLSPTGNNVLTYSGGISSQNADNINFGEEEMYEDIQGNTVAQNFCSIAVDSDGYIYALDSAYGRIYVYDGECNSITVFGGGLGQGYRDGTFVTPSVIETVNGDVLVADSSKNNITIFRKTTYGILFYQANNFSLEGEYAAAEPYWQQVMELSGNNQLAFKGLAQAALLEEDYTLALQYARLGDDQASYEQAFEQLFNAFLVQNLWWIALSLILLCGGVATFLVVRSRRQIVLLKSPKLQTSLQSVFHPFRCFNDVKFLGRGSVGIAAVCIVLFYVITVLKSLAGGFMYVIVDTKNFNALMILGGTVGLVLLFVVANWGLCSLFEGKGTFRDVLIVTAYALIPQLISGLFYILASHVIIPSSSAIITAVTTVCYLWTAIILIIGLITIHDFSFTKTILTGLLTIIGIILMIFMLFMVLTFFQNFIGFAVSLFREALSR